MNTKGKNMKAEIKKIARHYGIRRQTLKTLEELNELGAELRWLANLNIEPLHLVSVEEIDKQLAKVCEEIADVEVMIAQLKFLFDCDEQVETIKKFKVNRELERMKKENESKIQKISTINK